MASPKTERILLTRFISEHWSPINPWSVRQCFGLFLTANAYGPANRVTKFFRIEWAISGDYGLQNTPLAVRPARIEDTPREFACRLVDDWED